MANEQLMESIRAPLYNLHYPLALRGGTCIQFSSLSKQASCINTVLWRQFSVSTDGERHRRDSHDFYSWAWCRRHRAYSASHFRQAWQGTSSLILIQETFMAENMQAFISANTNWARVESVACEIFPRTVPLLRGMCCVGCWFKIGHK